MFAALVGAVLLAQSTTTCRPTIIGMPSAGVTCDTDGPDRPILDTGSSSGPGLGAIILHGVASAKAAKLRREVGERVAAGDCAEARSRALLAGDFDLAERAASMCAPSAHVASNQLAPALKDFAANPAHPFFWIVLPRMAALAKAGQTKSLQDAYDQAVAASPEVAAVKRVQASAAR